MKIVIQVRKKIIKIVVFELSPTINLLLRNRTDLNNLLKETFFSENTSGNTQPLELARVGVGGVLIESSSYFYISKVAVSHKIMIFSNDGRLKRRE